jgi:hypothetical protein
MVALVFDWEAFLAWLNSLEMKAPGEWWHTNPTGKDVQQVGLHYTYVEDIQHGDRGKFINNAEQMHFSLWGKFLNLRPLMSWQTANGGSFPPTKEDYELVREDISDRPIVMFGPKIFGYWLKSFMSELVVPGDWWNQKPDPNLDVQEVVIEYVPEEVNQARHQRLTIFRPGDILYYLHGKLVNLQPPASWAIGDAVFPPEVLPEEVSE